MASKIRALTEQCVDVPRAVHLGDADRCCLTDVKLKTGVKDFLLSLKAETDKHSLTVHRTTGIYPGSLEAGEWNPDPL